MENLSDKQKKRVLAVILFTIFVDLVGFGVLIPVIPLLLANPASKYFLLGPGVSINQGYILLGWISAMWALMIFLVAPIFGQLSDKYGRRRILLLALAGTSLSYFLFAVGIILKNIPLLFFSRAFDGVTGSSIAVAQASVADITAQEDRAKNFGYMGAAFGLGIILGPFLGGKLSDPSLVSWFNATTPFWFAGILSFLNVIFIAYFYKETLLEKNRQMKITLTRAFSNILKAARLGNIRTTLTTNFLVQGGFAFFTTFFSVFLIRRLAYSQGNIGDFFSFLGLWMVLAQAVFLPLVLKKLNECGILRYSIFALAIFIFFMLFLQKSWQLYLLTPVFAVANGFTGANLTALISRSADKNIQGEILGINSSVQSLAMSIPPILSGYLAARFLPETSILVASIVIFAAWLVFSWGWRQKTVCEWQNQ
jgi:DHA1 family tetracycline resistance protein-like MFS transporter